MKNTESALRHAWKTLRYDHPQIACIAHGDTKVYEVPSNAALDSWLDETFIISPAMATKEELLKSFRPSTQATLHYLPHSSEIIIHTSHWRTDFIGGLGLLRNLLSAFIEPRHVQFGDEGKNLSPSRDEVAKFSSSGFAELPAIAQERNKAATDLVMQMVGNLPSIGLPTQKSHLSPGGTLRSGLTLEPSATSAIISASKKRGLTVTTALHAALIVATQQVASVSSSSNTYTSWGIFNIRPLLPAPYDNFALHPAVVQIIGLPLTLHTSSYADLAFQLKHYYKQTIPPSADSRIHEGVIVPFTNQMTDLAGQSPPADLPAPTEPILISMGILDGYLNCDYRDIIEVKDFWIGLEVTTPQLVCYLWTWQSRMTLSALYNEVFYERHFIQDFLKRVIDVLSAELEIKEA